MSICIYLLYTNRYEARATRTQAMNEKLFLSTQDSTPMYEQIMDQIATKVMAGDWPPGQALPSIRELASSSGVSVITVKRAYLELERAGVIVTRQGKGSFVAETQDLPKQLIREQFDSHLLGMLSAANKLGMREKEVIGQVRATMAIDATEVLNDNRTVAKR
jgi:GntR family transcriptional regulator